MYLLIVYDVDVKRVNRVHKFLKSYLHWRQNSVFEGEVSKAQFNEIKTSLKDLIDETRDSVMIYKFPSKKYVSLYVLGIEKNTIDFIL
ncbi:CRISPR-associated protein, Cas2 family [Methanothermus fervidus DSM 2088]|uniref:CRISPR-associated endoribonuclease Cas2 n=1 Tax=Methanothermus fervidus (strain ATCC 43054 / DSM 2088 / JCM 10308 / V24 S) TaxID=523846 RepID=E3GWF8_METFV|nr:CRISPR-associated endonuclease Cas2 [Methanothermus fervidus]ADP77923.1 CRISPR-associated protein, Cas2 family [Methanothermus fervidus DSM 2088]